MDFQTQTENIIKEAEIDVENISESNLNQNLKEDIGVLHKEINAKIEMVRQE